MNRFLVVNGVAIFTLVVFVGFCVDPTKITCPTPVAYWMAGVAYVLLSALVVRKFGPEVGRGDSFDDYFGHGAARVVAFLFFPIWFAFLLVQLLVVPRSTHK